MMIATMGARAANVNVPVAAEFHHSDPNSIEEQGIK